MPTPRKPKIDPTDRTSDPAHLAGPTAFALVLDIDYTTMHEWTRNGGPPGFPDPDDWKETAKRRVPQWRLSTMWHYADHHHRPGRRQPGAGRPATAHRYAGDPRLTRARQALAQHPNATRQALAEDLHHTQPTTSVRVWLEILTTARKHPHDNHQEKPAP